MHTLASAASIYGRYREMTAVVAAGAAAALCAALFLLPLKRALRLGVLAAGLLALALLAARGRGGRAAVAATALVAVFTACAAGHAAAWLHGGGPAGRRAPPARLALRSDFGPARAIRKPSRALAPATVDGQSREYRAHRLRAHDIPLESPLRAEYAARLERLDRARGTDEFDREAGTLREFYRAYAVRPCTAVALGQIGGICWIVSVVDLIYNTPLLSLVSPATREWTVRTYETSLRRADRAATCSRLPPHVEDMYARLGPSFGAYNLRSSFENNGGKPEMLLMAIFLADGVIVPRWDVEDLAGRFRFGSVDIARLYRRATAAEIGQAIDEALRSYDIVLQRAAVILVPFAAPAMPTFRLTLDSPWFQQLALACGARAARDVYGGFVSTDDHALDFTVCYRGRGRAEVVPRTYGMSGIDDAFLPSEAPDIPHLDGRVMDDRIENVVLVVRTGER